MREASTKNKEHNLSNYDKVSMVIKTKNSLPFLGNDLLARVSDIGQLVRGI